MKKAEREVYINLTQELDSPLCTFCKYYEGGYSPCDNGSCEHPLAYYVSFPHFEESVEPGDDCWAFRPDRKIDYIAEIVSVVLSQDFVEWMSEEKDGKIIVKGSKTFQYV